MSTHIRPFAVAVSQESLDDLSYRLDRVRWTSDIPGSGSDYGISLGVVQRLVASAWQLTERHFRKIDGHKDLWALATILGRPSQAATSKEQVA